LNALTHPRIQARKAELIAALGAAGEPLAAYEVPLLYENQLEAELAPVVVVGVPEALQLARAMKRGSASEAEVRARLLAQLPLTDKLRRADYVIDNAGSLEHTAAQADSVLRAICQQLAIDPARYFKD
jgi:dephospho-CoA kinase